MKIWWGNDHIMLQKQAMNILSGSNHDSAGVVPIGSFKGEPEK